MEAPLCLTPDHHSALLQQIPIYVCTRNTTIWRKTDADELAKPTGVVVPLRLSISESFEDGVGLQDLAFEEP